MNHRAIITAPLLLGLIGTSACQRGNEFVPPPPPKVTVQKPETRNVTAYSDFTGRTEAIETVEVRARVKGFLDEMHFTASDLVVEGQDLFTIEPEPFVAAVAAAEADRAMKVAARDLAKVTNERAAEAYERGALAELELEETKAHYDAALAALDAAQAAVDVVKLDLGYTKITAPVAGRVSRDLVSVGNLVGANDATLLTIIVVDDPMYVYFNVDERFLLAFLKDRPAALERRREGRPTDEQNEQAAVPILLQLADGTDYAQPGRTDFGENRIDSTTGTLTVRAIFPNAEGLLYPGMFVRVRVPMETSDALLVPELALQRDQVGSFLLVVDADGIVQRRDVELGFRDGVDRVIRSGLDPDDRVVVNGIQRARPGMPVSVEEAAPEQETAAAAPAP